MYTICLMMFASGAPKTTCHQAPIVGLNKAKAACTAAARDPLNTCESFSTSDGNRWFFVYQAL